MRNKLPVHIRRNVESYNDPYIDDESPMDNTVCSKCGDVYMSGRWYSKAQAPERKGVSEKAHAVVCPACRKLRDRMPGGVVRISGGFFWEHQDEIMNLIRNEASKAQAVNPLERVMGMDSSDGEVEITTTNEKLAQRIGRALHKAYDGHIEYKFSEDTKLARVNWHRDA